MTEELTTNPEVSGIESDGIELEGDGLLSDEVYMGFIQAICWSTGVGSPGPTMINEPGELWGKIQQPDGEICWGWADFSRRRFIELFAEFDAEGCVILAKLIDDCQWAFYCTEAFDGPNPEDLEADGYKFMGEWV